MFATERLPYRFPPMLTLLRADPRARRADRNSGQPCTKTRITIMSDKTPSASLHKQAASDHEDAAKHHRKAADNHDKNKLDDAKDCSKKAMDCCNKATKNTASACHSSAA
jgi:hypothetical protein